MKVALIAESFLPHTNGVTNSLLRVIEHLTDRGDEALLIAPESKEAGPDYYGNAKIVRLPSLGWPGYDDVRVSLSRTPRIGRLLAAYRPDVVHLASPFMLGWAALKAAQRLTLPTVAVYQTEVPSYAENYRAAWGEPLLWNRVRNIHARADLNLAPSTFAMSQLHELGVPRLRWWPRGVDTTRFHPRHRDAALRRRWAPDGEVIVGYAGRLAAEKQVGDLARLAGLPGIRLVIIGDGPMRSQLGAQFPDAIFTNYLGSHELARALASLDVFVHPGQFETFCQTIQEAHASGVPVVAPRRGGPVDLVTPGQTGYLYEPGRLDHMADAVLALATDADHRARSGVRARAAVEHRTWTGVCEQLFEYYNEAIAARALPVMPTMFEQPSLQEASTP